MKNFNLENYLTKIYVLLFSTNKLYITQLSLEKFFKDFDIPCQYLDVSLKTGTTKLNQFIELMELLFKNGLITDKKIVKIYKNLLFKYKLSEFEGIKDSYLLDSNINKIIEEDKVFLIQIMESLDKNLELNLSSKNNRIFNFNFNKIIELFEILFIYPELLPLKECMILFIKSLEKSVKIKDKKNNEKIELIKIGNKKDGKIFNVDFLVNFLVIISKYLSYKHNNYHKNLCNESNSFSYLLWYIYFCIEKYINEKPGSFYSEFIENLNKNPYLIIAKYFN